MKKNIFSKGFIGAATVACVLLGAGIFGIPYYGNNFVPDSHVDIDINPGVEIVTNKNNKVIEILSTNNDGKTVIDGMNLKNSELKVAVNALIGSMVQKGYIENDNTGILVTVRNNNQDRADKVKAEVLDDINFALYKNDVQAAVINQTLKNTKNADKFARENNVSIGKSVFVLNLAAKDSTLDARELAKMRVSDIADLVVKKGIDIRDIVDYDYDDSIWENTADAIEDIDENANKAAGINTVAISSTKKQIGVEGAKQIALAHAKVAQKDVTFIKAELETENGRLVYDIEFYSGNVEYDYDIDAVSGDIVSYDYDIENYNIPVQPTEVQQTNADTVDIGVEKAKEIALSHAGHSIDKVSFVKAEIDYEDGIKVYDIDFHSGNVEYDYEINAATGSILSVDWDIEDYSIPAPEPAPTEAPVPAPTAAPAPAPTKAASSGISAERAKQIALSHAGVGSAHFTKVELDTEDGIRVYEIEFKVGNVEYDYDINVATGAIVSSSSEIDD
ncbi:hypothetical protein HMPREF0491_02500 [Lachnospiraceae oral taxon 107 str. F0167]|nr:hypothetical protein HMPREF0491_02500 [Lachnospiraceae oral taxon 107 str. F0167]